MDVFVFLYLIRVFFGGIQIEKRCQIIVTTTTMDLRLIFDEDEVEVEVEYKEKTNDDVEVVFVVWWLVGGML